MRRRGARSTRLWLLNFYRFDNAFSNAAQWNYLGFDDERYAYTITQFTQPLNWRYPKMERAWYWPWFSYRSSPFAPRQRVYNENIFGLYYIWDQFSPTVFYHGLSYFLNEKHFSSIYAHSVILMLLVFLLVRYLWLMSIIHSISIYCIPNAWSKQKQTGWFKLAFRQRIWIVNH